MRTLPALTVALLALCGMSCGSEPETTCYSPESNLDLAYEGDLEGCECAEAEDEDVCVRDSTGRGVALVCRQGQWKAVEDGPCTPGP